MKLDEKSSIPSFFVGRSILITGSTGFLGKVLVEKLLRSCPDVAEIFLIMRPKKNLSIDDRLRQMLELPLFDKLRRQNPAAFGKVIPISGDVSEEGLGLPPIERRVVIERVSVIFHVAANIKFDDSLRNAILLNVRGTREMCILAAQMKKLVSFQHVSTTYGNVDRPVIDEVIYPAHANWKAAIKIAESFDEYELNMFSAKYVGKLPNTYVFTKQLAEHVIKDYEGILPCTIFRPSVVVSSLKDPVPGWIDNFNGPMGIMVGGGKGILRTMYAEPDVKVNFIPVDLVVRGMIVAVWQRGIKTITQTSKINVYNCSSRNKFITNEEMANVGFRANEQVPVENILWYPDSNITTSKLVYYANFFLFQLLPAVFIDIVLKLSGVKPRLVKLQTKIFTAIFALQYFLTREWTFNHTNYLSLSSVIPPSEYQDFDMDFENHDIREYFMQCLLGSKKYLLKEDVNDYSKAKAHFARLKFLDRALKTWLIVGLIWFAFSSGFFAHLLNRLSRLTASFLEA